MLRSFGAFVVVMTVILLALVMPSSAQNECIYKPNMNVTGDDIIPPKFVASSYDCCALCGSNPNCAVAVYSNFLCHLKAFGGSLEQAIGPTVILKASGPTGTGAPYPTNTGYTSVPPSTYPFPTNTPTQPPMPTGTPVPTPSGPHGLVEITKCTYSSRCSVTADNTCETKVYREGVCHTSHKDHTSILVQCYKSFIRKIKFNTSDCSGPDESSTSIELDKCIQQPNFGEYRMAHCYKDAMPNVGTPIEHNHCTSSCGVDCSTALFIDGQCRDNGDGTSTIGHCYSVGGGVVTYTTFPNSNQCLGHFKTTGFPANTCYKTPNLNYNTEKCSAVVPPGPTPPPPPPAPSPLGPPVNNVLVTKCTYSKTCNFVADSSCSIRTHSTGACHIYEGNLSQSVRYTCFGSFVEQEIFTASPKCFGPSTTNSLQLGCTQAPNFGPYYGVECHPDSREVLGHTIRRRVCTKNCTADCRTELYIDGRCQRLQDGTSRIGRCFHQPATDSGVITNNTVATKYVTYAVYPNSPNCDDNTPRYTVAEPVDTCWTTSDFNYITNMC